MEWVMDQTAVQGMAVGWLVERLLEWVVAQMEDTAVVLAVEWAAVALVEDTAAAAQAAAQAVVAQAVGPVEAVGKNNVN
jgi:hypothetical protein